MRWLSEFQSSCTQPLAAKLCWLTWHLQLISTSPTSPTPLALVRCAFRRCWCQLVLFFLSYAIAHSADSRLVFNLRILGHELGKHSLTLNQLHTPQSSNCIRLLHHQCLCQYSTLALCGARNIACAVHISRCNHINSGIEPAADLDLS